MSAVALEGVGELACMLALASGLADSANDDGDLGAVWRLAVLLRAAKARANELHDLAAAQVMAEGAPQ